MMYMMMHDLDYLLEIEVEPGAPPVDAHTSKALRHKIEKPE